MEFNGVQSPRLSLSAADAEIEKPRVRLHAPLDVRGCGASPVTRSIFRPASKLTLGVNIYAQPCHLVKQRERQRRPLVARGARH